MRALLGALAKLRKATISFVMYDCLSSRMKQLGITGQIFVKFDIWVLFENVSRKYEFH